MKESVAVLVVLLGLTVRQSHSADDDRGGGVAIDIRVYIMRLSMLAPPPTRDRVGNFPCLEWQACPRGRDIESLKCACKTHAARVPSRFEF